MTISELHEKLKSYPTILHIEDELFLINCLQKTKLDDILSNTNKLVDLLASLQSSHQSNGIFEVCAENVQIFFDFAAWIKQTQKHIETDIEKYIDGFDTDFTGNIKLGS